MQHSTSRPAEKSSVSNRRGFLQRSGQLAVGAGLLQSALPNVHAAEDNTIRLALIGCGNRGSGAARDAMNADGGPVQLYAMADFFGQRLESSHEKLTELHPQQVNVPPERRFVGFDSYKAAIDALRPGDIAMLTGYAGWRPVQLEYAVAKGVNVFMEKSFATDPPAARRIIKAGELAQRKNLKIAAGLMCRHSKNRQELIRRIRDGELGEIQLIRAYRMHAVGPLRPKPPEENELFYQIRNFVRFFWVSGGLFAEMDIHQIDEICWLKDALPVKAHGVGGRAADNTDPSQNLDSFSAEWTFADGAKAYDVVRYLRGCHNEFATYVLGTKRAAKFSGDIHAGDVHIYKDGRCESDNILWKAPDETETAWQAEWNALLKSIRGDLPHNEAERAALSNVTDMMGRAAIHMGQEITWEQAMNSNFQWAPDIDAMDEDSPPPLQPDEAGRYPVPIPGQWVEI